MCVVGKRMRTSMRTCTNPSHEFLRLRTHVVRPILCFTATSAHSFAGCILVWSSLRFSWCCKRHEPTFMWNNHRYSLWRTLIEYRDIYEVGCYLHCWDALHGYRVGKLLLKICDDGKILVIALRANDVSKEIDTHWSQWCRRWEKLKFSGVFPDFYAAASEMQSAPYCAIFVDCQYGPAEVC